MAKPRKLKSGSWNIQVYDYRDQNGKPHYTSITAPTKQECIYKAAHFQRQHPKRTPAQEMTVGAAVDRYIELCSVLSPTSTTGYKKVRQAAFQGLMDMPVKRLTDESVQMAINKECHRIAQRTGKQISAKTVHNEWGVVAAALKKVCHLSFEVTLPKKKRSIKQYPEPELVFAAIMDCPDKLPCLLSIWLTFTISEILGLKCSSIRDGYIYVDQVRVFTDRGYVEKGIAKTARRNRVHEIPPRLMTMISELDVYQEYLRTGKDALLFPATRSKIYNSWTRTAKKHGLNLSFHDLRHMSASIALMLGIPDLYEEERGGWSTNYIMKTNYDHTFSSGRRKADQEINEYVEKCLNVENERNSEKPAKSMGSGI